LATGAADLDQDGQVSVDDLYDYLQAEVRERNHRQTPTLFVHSAQGRLYIARNPRAAGAVALPASGTARAPLGVSGHRALASKRAPSHPPTTAALPLSERWDRLLTYYRACLEREAALRNLLEIQTADLGGRPPAGQSKPGCYARYPERVEKLLSGAASTLPLEANSEVSRLVDTARVTEQSLFCGYPVIVIATGNRTKAGWKLAPLFVREAKSVVTPGG
jgi:hypothetical protein